MRSLLATELRSTLVPPAGRSDRATESHAHLPSLDVTEKNHGVVPGASEQRREQRPVELAPVYNVCCDYEIPPARVGAVQPMRLAARCVREMSCECSHRSDYWEGGILSSEGADFANSQPALPNARLSPHGSACASAAPPPLREIASLFRSTFSCMMPCGGGPAAARSPSLAGTSCSSGSRIPTHHNLRQVRERYTRAERRKQHCGQADSGAELQDLLPLAQSKGPFGRKARAGEKAEGKTCARGERACQY